ncbi:MAG TPA: hypothetical protein VGF56_04970 [Rhizomicrobium sp.]|jgi:hypothetical protein
MTRIGTGLEYWDAAGAPEALARMTFHPARANAMRHSVRGGLSFFDAEPQANALFLDVGSFALGIIALYLDATGGVSHRHLRQMSQSSSILSGGRASAMLATMRLKGFIRRDAGEGRQVLYRPEPLLKTFFRGRMRIEIEACAMIEPAIAPFLARWDEPAVCERFWSHFGAQMIRAGQNRLPELEAHSRIGARRAGSLILYQILADADRGGDFPAVAPFGLSVSATARRFGVSRSQVLRSVREIAREGLIARGGHEADGTVLPALAATFPSFWAHGQIGILASAHRAMLETGA